MQIKCVTLEHPARIAAKQRLAIARVARDDFAINAAIAELIDLMAKFPYTREQELFDRGEHPMFGNKGAKPKNTNIMEMA